MKKLTLAFITVLTILVSCKKDSGNDDKPNNTSRTLRYEVTGNFTGTFTAAYTTISGGTSHDEVTSLPWTKEITYAANVTAATMAISGGGGVPGQKVTFIIKRGGTPIGAPIEQVANSSGVFSIAGQVVIF